MALPGKLTETSYLTADNAGRYRCIMRVFYDSYEKMRFQLYKEDVLELLLVSYPELEGLTMDQLKLDLSALTEWKNLIAIQDPRKVYTIAEYKNKQFRYSMSEAAVEIERMAARLENLFLEPASLSTNYFLRIEHSLQEADTLNLKDLKAVNEWWKDLQEDFRCLNQNYQDYLREFYSGRSEKLLRSVEFVLHKDRFIAYLEDFIRSLQMYTDRITAILLHLDPARKQKLLERTVESELAIPRPQSELHEDLRTYLHDSIFGRWESLEQWFIGSDERLSESLHILDITNEVIQKIIQNAALIVQLQNWGISRKADYQRWIRMFQNCSDIEEAHRLSACLFGSMHARHFTASAPRSTDSISSAVSQEDPFPFLLSSHNRQYRPRTERAGYTVKSEEKLRQREAYLARLEENRKCALRFIHDGILSIDAIREEVPASLRTSLLSWISAANINTSLQGRTEYGWVFTLSRKPGTSVLHCEDGDLTMPNYVLSFSEVPQ